MNKAGSLGTVPLKAKSHFGSCGGLTVANTDLNRVLHELLLSVPQWLGEECIVLLVTFIINM